MYPNPCPQCGEPNGSGCGHGIGGNQGGSQGITDPDVTDAGSVSLHRNSRKSERDVKKFRRWALLSVAGALAVLVGGRAQEAVALDPDNMGVAR